MNARTGPDFWSDQGNHPRFPKSEPFSIFDHSTICLCKNYVMSIYIVLQLENIVWYAITAISSRLMLYVVSDTEREFEINGNIKTKFVFLKQKNVFL